MAKKVIRKVLRPAGQAVTIRVKPESRRQRALQELRQLVQAIQARARRNPRLAREALRDIEPARREFYARRARHQRPA